MLTIIGLMSGTSADGIDAALISTDGQSECKQLDSHFAPYRPSTRTEIMKARSAPQHYLADANNREALIAAITQDHISAINHLIKNVTHNIDLIGFHGQTIYHNPKRGRTIQLGDGNVMARMTGIDTIYDFRQADINAGGQGAPLAPIYHQFLVEKAGIPQPAVIINIGGVANLTYINTANNQLLGFDVGPGNGLMDALLQRETGDPFDQGGQIAAGGIANMDFVETALLDMFFAENPPKSLDWGAFLALLEQPQLSKLSLPDAMATLCAFSAAAILMAIDDLPIPPAAAIVAGGGRHNQTLMAAIRAGLPDGCQLLDAGEYGLHSDMIEAELIGFLAARHHYQLPSSFASTTGAKSPQIAGVRATAYKNASDPGT